MLATAGLFVECPIVDGDDVLRVEQRPDEDGRSVLVRRRGDGSIEELGESRTTLREYGGRAHAARDGVVVASDPGDQRLYRLDGGARVPLTGEPPAPRAWPVRRPGDHA